MSKLSKIKQTKVNKEKYDNPIIPLLKQGTNRNELSNLLHCTDSQARQEVSEISLFYPLISSSSKSGYRLAKNINDMSNEDLKNEIDLVTMTLNEHLSRVKVLKKKCKPLIAWLKKANEKLEEGKSGNEDN